MDPVENEDVEVVREYRVCSACIGEPFLSANVEHDGTHDPCTYCTSFKKTISIGELAKQTKNVLEEHFYQTSLDSPRFDDERQGDSIVEVIASAAEIDEAPAKHVQQVLENDNYDHDMAQMQEECPFEEEAHYAEKGPQTYELSAAWSDFETGLKTETRLFNREAEATLDSVFTDLAGHKTKTGKPVIVLAGPGTALGSLYRARTFHTDGKLNAALVRPDLEIGPPPWRASVAGRMNSRGISVFYGSGTPEAALAEIRPPVGSRVVVGRFDLIRPLQLLDVEALRSIFVSGSLFDPTFMPRLEKARFLQGLSRRITVPVMPDDEPFEYLVTQAIADYLANRKDPLIDGIIYPSVQCGHQEVNAVLFHKSARVEKLPIPEGTDISASLYDHSDGDVSPDYWVWENTPPEKPKEDDENSFDVNAFLLSSRESNDDVREPTLRLELTSVKVHHVEMVSFKTEEFDVKRHRSEKTESKF
jgi:hypothetical protein